MLLTWVPSQKAMKANLVPADYSQYDIDTDNYGGVHNDAVIWDSVCVGATTKMRHAYNNEAAAAWDAAKKRDDEPLEDTPEVRATFLHNWRVKWRDSFIEGKLGLRRISVTAPKDELTVEAELIALGIIREHAESNGVAFTYNVVNARTLAATYGKGNQTIGDIIANMLNAEKSPNRARRIWAEAQKILDQRAAAKAAMAEDSDEDEDIFADEEEAESEDAAN